MPYAARQDVPRRSVHFSSHPSSSPRSLRHDEVFILKDFTQHMDRCSSCALLECRSTLRYTLCRRGKSKGVDMLEYLMYRNGRYVSRVDCEQGLGWTEVMIPSQYRLAKLYLRCQETRASPATYDAPDRPNHSRQRLVSTSQITLRPEVRTAQDDQRPEDMILQVTIPSFTIPVRLEQGCSRVRLL